MTTLLNIADWIFIFVLGLPVLYLFVFALFSTRKSMDDYPQAKRRRKFVTLIPAYKSDAVIVRTAQAALRQEYPAQLHEVVVIADRLKPQTLAELRTLPIRVLEVSFENSSKAKALNFAVEELGPEAAEAVTILDADNLAGEDFIARLNDVFDSGVQAVQAHRTAKNRDTDTAVLDAASEEINNAIFRRGHVALGLSSALIGSGMAFEYKWFRDNIARCTTSGEDKELEALLLRQGIYIDYIDGLRVLDEKVQGEGAYYNQRRRWIAAQFYALGSAVRQLPGAIAAGNLDYCDKLLQWCLPPRILLMGLVPLWTAAMTVFDPLGSIKWWIVLLLLLFALALALPDEQTDRQLGRALRRMPVLFLLTAANLFRLRGTKDKFTVDTSTGNGKLTYPIALMTADEVRFAGGVYGINAPTWYYYNSSNGSSTGSTLWWLLSPSTWTANGIYASVFRMLDSSYPGRLTYNAVYSSDGVRPVISLKSCIKYSTGNGSANNPYTILETSSGC